MRWWLCWLIGHKPLKDGIVVPLLGFDVYVDGISIKTSGRVSPCGRCSVMILTHRRAKGGEWLHTR